jgi:ATP-dependent Clp protease ATP-binding subunit ClpB
VIQKYVQDPLAEMILMGKVKDGQTVSLSARGSELIIDGAPVRVAA